MIDPDEALSLVLEHATIQKAISLPLSQALGCALAETALADRDYPPFDRAMMDGVAVRISDAGKTVRACGETAAGQAPEREVAAGQCINIMTGAPCPPGTEAVVPEEMIRRTGDRIALPASIKREQNIDRKGSETPEGAVVLREGAILTPLGLGALATIGCARVEATPFPELALIITGMELVNPEDRPGAYQIRDSNGLMLEALATATGVKKLTRLRVEDTEASIAGALERAGGADLVLLTGGVSAGKYDLVPGQVQEYGGQVIFQKVRQKPGMPLLLARKGDQLIFGLPGNPLSVHLCFHRYVSAAIRKMAGLSPERPVEQGILTEEVTLRGDRTAYLLGTARRKGPLIEVAPVPRVSTADLFSTAGADCYLHLPAGKKKWDAGEGVDFTRLEHRGWED